LFQDVLTLETKRSKYTWIAAHLKREYGAFQIFKENRRRHALHYYRAVPVPTRSLPFGQFLKGWRALFAWKQNLLQIKHDESTTLFASSAFPTHVLIRHLLNRKISSGPLEKLIGVRLVGVFHGG